MNIYKLTEDFNFKDFSLETKSFNSFKGQSLSTNWKKPILHLLENKLTKKNEVLAEKKKAENFDARCYGSILLMKSKFDHLFEHLEIEKLPVSTSLKEEFSFYNVTNVVQSINFEGLDFKQSMSMIKENRINFTLEKIKEEVIFRDEKLNNFYYCSEKFIEIIDNNSIKGLRFVLAGAAT